MKIAVWKTGHQISDTVAERIIWDFYKNHDGRIASTYDSEFVDAAINYWDVHLGYGILRGMDNVLTKSEEQKKPWFNIDRGYFNPGHFDGYYRISYKGTQAKWHENIPKQDIEFELEDWRLSGNHILLCPPTEHVCKFYDINPIKWKFDALQIWLKAGGGTMSIRTKDCHIPLDEHLKDCQGVITFNSSIGWKALQRGIPVYSDPDHSIIGSYYKAKMKNPIDFLSDEYKSIDRKPLFEAMAAHQFTLEEISKGKAWKLLNHYLKKNLSDTEKEG